MSDSYLPPMDALPPEVLSALSKRGDLSPGEVSLLTSYLIKTPNIDPALADMIGAKIIYGSKPMTPFEAAAGADKAPEVGKIFNGS